VGVSTPLRPLAIALFASTLVAACDEPTASLSGVVEDFNGGVVEGATLTIGDSTATTGSDGRYQLDDLAAGSAVIVASAPGYASLANNVALVSDLPPQILAELRAVAVSRGR
jgi:hypothetical protein